MISVLIGEQHAKASCNAQLNALGINKVGNHKVKHSFWNKLLEGSKTFSSSVKGGRSLRDEVLLGDLPHPNRPFRLVHFVFPIQIM